MEILDKIRKRIDLLEEEQKELKVMREQIYEALVNDGEMREAEEREKKARKEKNLIKEALLNEPEYKKVSLKIKEAKQEVKDLQYMLSSELIIFKDESNSLEFEDSHGNLRRIEIKAKAKKTNQQSLFGGKK